MILLISYPAFASRVHRVERGETLYTIARDYGVYVQQIISRNNLKSQTIHPRQVLVIPEETVYYIRRGDTLYEISLELGIEMEELIEENNLDNPGRIFPGQILSLPGIRKQSSLFPSSVTTYEIQPGDTLYRISHRFGIAIDTLVNLNNLSNPDHLQIGQTLMIPEYSFSEMRNMYPEHFFLKGTSGEAKVALTFDDGPDAIYTPQVLDVLTEYEVPATFFYVGERTEEHPEVVERTVEEGHVLANHSWSHPALTGLSDLEVYEEVMDTELSMELISGQRTSFLRPPYGFVSQKNVEQLKELDYRIIQWSVDSLDWQEPTVDEILINTIPDIDDDAIILFHSAGGVTQDLSSTVEVLPELIHTLEVQGYEFVTVDQIIDFPPYKD